MKKPKNDFVSVKILRADFKKVKRWTISKEKKFYEIINLLINK